ncbi:MAG TPA: hypothetical protein VFG63_13385 [Nocardioidaceae bacterium]|nr:hypothetical protein [Nocardioidaceae bacterium]
MAARVVLHVGAMKSGTSYIQNRLFANQEVLRDQGVLVPGRSWRDQVLAVTDVLEHKRVGPVSAEGKWQWLLDEAAAWPGTVVVSMEYLGPIGQEKIRKVVDSFPDVDLHVVMTVRDLNRNIPAMWQETVQNFRVWTWKEHLDGVRGWPEEHNPPGDNFWRQQDTPAMAGRWAEAVGPQSLTLVTVPHPGADSDVLWHRFCSVAGIDGDACAPIPRTNEALGAASTLVMRRLNELLRESGLAWKDYSVLVKFGLAKAGLALHKGEEPALGFPVPRWVKRRSKEMIERFEALGVRVEGDLAELKPVPVAGTDPSSVSEREQLEAALVGLREIVRLWVADRERRPE